MLRSEHKNLAADSSDLRARAEELIRGHVRNVRAPSPEEVQQLVHELEVHRIELETQNEALREAQHELEASRDRYVDLYDFAPVGYVTLDEAGSIRGINLTTAKLLGVQRSQLVGKPFASLVARAHKTAFRSHVRQCFAERQEGMAEVLLTLREDRSVWVQLRSAPAEDADRTITLCRTAVIDITERKRMEAEKLALERQLHHAQKLQSLGVLAGGIAHDFNNILTVILGNAELALDELSPMSSARESIREIEKACTLGAELAKQMLAYSGKGRFVVEPIDAGELVAGMTHLLEVSISKKAVLQCNLAESLPTFDGDVAQIRQVIMNLIINASEAIGDTSGIIALSTSAVHCDRAYLDDADEMLRAGPDRPLPEGVYLCLEVADTGCGMDAKTIERIFDPFFTTKFTGRGLGMSAVLGIVRGHQGTLKIHSQVGNGSTFKVLFPANEPADNGSTITTTDEAERRDRSGSGTILFADDEEPVLAVGKRMLERIGFSVLTSPDGREAVKVFREHADEIVGVLLDLTMPHMDAEEAFREMRRLRPGIPVILCSGYNEQEATQRFAGKGLAGFVQKPFGKATLREKLMAVLAIEDVTDAKKT